MKTFTRILISLTALTVAGCSTMTFTNGPHLQDAVVREQWHHLALAELVEISPPVRLEYLCHRQQWDSITVERTFLNGLAGSALMLDSTTPLIGIYSPWAVTYRCRDPLE